MNKNFNLFMSQLQETNQTLDFFCDFYNYDGEYESNYFIGEQMTVTDDMRVSDTRLGDSEAFVMYRFTDIYNQHYWSQAL